MEVLFRLVVVLSVLLLVLLICCILSKKIKTDMLSYIVQGLVIVMMATIISYFMIYWVFPHPDIKVDCENLANHTLNFYIQNGGEQEAQNFYLIIENPFVEGWAFNFYDDLDKQFCELIPFPSDSILLSEKTRNARTLIKCDYFPSKYNLTLTVKNWAGDDFILKYGAGNLEAITRSNKEIKSCNWSEVCIGNPELCKP